MSQRVMIGRWLTPLISIFILRMSHSSSSDSMKVAIVTSWHKPTAVIDVSRSTERVSVVIGLVRLSIHASGHSSSMSRAMPTMIGMLRNARTMPPGPTVSPTDCLMP
jgi:hypothetical protein